MIKILIPLFHSVWVWALPPEGLYNGALQKPAFLSEALSSVHAGGVVVVGENHGLSLHQRQQLEVMKTLRDLGHKVSVGLEFFTYTFQDQVNLYREGQIEEESFLKTIEWGGIPFDFYRDQALFPDLSRGEKTWALNAPRSLTSQVTKVGLEGLSDSEKKLLPPQFQLGRDSYRRRFEKSVPHPLPPEKMARYFAAQSIWDDTMAWRASEFLREHPEQVLVIVVGEFHVQFGGGLPDRLKARGVSQVVTISQVDTSEMEESQLGEILQPSPVDGVRADFLWLGPAQNTSGL